MINISNCPLTGLKRKVEYDFLWYRNARQIIIKCEVSYFDANDAIITGLTRLKPYSRSLVASDSFVDMTGTVLTDQEVAAFNTANDAFVSYTNAVAGYNTAMTVYNEVLIPEYNAALETYNNVEIPAYNVLLAEYNDAMSQSPQNPLELEQPVPPTQPQMPDMPSNPAMSPEPQDPGPAPMFEYDFYAFVLGVQPLILPQLIEQMIQLRDSQGKFDI